VVSLVRTVGFWLV